MSSQGRLFETRAPPPAPEPDVSGKYRVPLEKYEVKSPWGVPDKKGTMFWQRMHKQLEMLPLDMREFFNFKTIGTNCEQIEQFGKDVRKLARIIAEYQSGNPCDHCDFDESRGRL
jgi:hypothetical protein